MATVSQNFVNRVRKLPKPSNPAQSLQPLFEAISNAIFAIDDLREEQPRLATDSSAVTVDIDNLSKPDRIEIRVSDDGIGLDADRFDAFKTLDTEFKRKKGGKGVGRLFWLDAFQSITVDSVFSDGEELRKRSFDFVLRNEDQIAEREHLVSARSSTGTEVRFQGLRGEKYKHHFPKRSDTFLNYFGAHFIADFLSGEGPKIVVSIDGDPTFFPDAISQLVHDKRKEILTEEHDEFGQLSITGYLCDEIASKGLEGTHQLHVLGNKRTVVSRPIDKLLGVHRIATEDRDDLVFHGCVKGEYLNDHLNEGRTAFNFEEKTLKELIRFCVDTVKARMLEKQIAAYAEERRQDYRKFVQTYPIYAFADEDTQLDRVPFGARSPEEFAAGLVKTQIRGEEERRRQVNEIITQLEGEKNVPANFVDVVAEVAADLKASEQRSLAHHVVKRKLALEVLERLILKVRARGDDERDFHLEETLHAFICPMQIIGNDPKELAPSPHDLWIVDERLAFTRAFASDVRLSKLLKESTSKLRPDLVLWDKAHGLGVIEPDDVDGDVDLSKPLEKVMIVEFKRPGREKYPKLEDQLEFQITKYLRQLVGGEIATYDARRVRFAKDCQFFCYIVADIDGDLKEQLDTWPTTADGEGRWKSLDGVFKGSSIEVIQWTDLINDAWDRNSATMAAAGLRRGKPVVR